MSVLSEDYLRSRVLQLRTSSPNLSGIVSVLRSGSSTNSRILQTSDLCLIGEALLLVLQNFAMLQTESLILTQELDHSLHLVHSLVMALKLRKQRLIITQHLLLSLLQVEIMDQLPTLLEQPLIMAPSQVLSLQMVR